MHTTAKKTGGRALVLVVMVATMALATLAVFASLAEAQPTGSFGHRPPKTILMKDSRVLQARGDGCYSWNYYQNGEWTGAHPADTLGCYSPPKEADVVGAKTKLHVRLAKPERPSVRVLARPRLNETVPGTSRAKAGAQGHLEAHKARRRDGGLGRFFRVNEPERQYYLRASTVWERVPGEHVSYGHASYEFHIETR